MRRVVEDRFLSSYSFFFAAWILHAGFPTVGLSSKFGLQRGVVLSQGNISIHGLDLWYRLRHMKTYESLLALASQHLTASICSADLLEYLKVSESICKALKLLESKRDSCACVVIAQCCC